MNFARKVIKLYAVLEIEQQRYVRSNDYYAYIEKLI